MNRVAVQAGGAWLRVATEDRVLAVAADGIDVATVLEGLLDAPVDELLVVHPGAGPDPGVTARADVVRAVPAAVAALAEHAGATGTVAADAVVVDVGYRGAEVTRVVDGRVTAVRRVAAGGERLDAVTVDVLARAGAVVPAAEARRVREALSLLPTAAAGPHGTVVPADALRAALTVPLAAVVEAVRYVREPPSFGPAPPVLLVGGVARTPLLAELLDAAGVDGVQVAARPDTAGVTGALRLPPVPVPPVPVRTDPPGRDPPRPTGTPVGSGAPASRRRLNRVRGPAPVDPAPSSGWLPPATRTRRPGRTLLGVLAAVVVPAVLLLAGVAVPAPTRAAPPSGELVQYGYAIDLPAGWAHTGGLPERRRSLLTPLPTPDGSDLISVERTPLGYDAGAEPARARQELRARFAAAVATGADLSGFDDDARYAGRPVVVYREGGGPAGADVDWYLVLDGDAQLSVGCRHTRAGAYAVAAACATVVGSLRRTA